MIRKFTLSAITHFCGRAWLTQPVFLHEDGAKSRDVREPFWRFFFSGGGGCLL